MRPSRIIVGEVREAEALDLLIALNSGLPGMGTLHGIHLTSRDVFDEMEPEHLKEESQCIFCRAMF